MHVDDEDKTTVAICDTGSNDKTNAVFINESGRYALIMGSKLESAHRFRHWVTAEVLPAMSGVAAGNYLSLSLFLWRVWSRRVFFSMVCRHASVRSTPVWLAMQTSTQSTSAISSARLGVSPSLKDCSP